MRRAKPYSMTRTSPSMKDLNSLTIVELKKILKEQNLTVSGNKPELISRIEEFQDNFLAIDDGECRRLYGRNGSIWNLLGSGDDLRHD